MGDVDGAGGVSIGAVANLIVTPAVSILIGIIAGSVSTLGITSVGRMKKPTSYKKRRRFFSFSLRLNCIAGYIYLTPLLQSKIPLFDTCGVHNLHGMPGLLGGIVSAFAVAHPIEQHASGLFYNIAKSAITSSHPVHTQVGGVFAAWGFALVSGALSGTKRESKHASGSNAFVVLNIHVTYFSILLLK